jgi:hypothetical protein
VTGVEQFQHAHATDGASGTIPLEDPKFEPLLPEPRLHLPATFLSRCDKFEWLVVAVQSGRRRSIAKRDEEYRGGVVPRLNPT